jgi:hypothetical protein
VPTKVQLRGLGFVALVLPLAAAGNASQAGAVPANDTPAGFWFGSDSFTVPVTGMGPFIEPVIGGNYGGYIGMVGTGRAGKGSCSRAARSRRGSSGTGAPGSARGGTGPRWPQPYEPPYTGSAP